MEIDLTLSDDDDNGDVVNNAASITEQQPPPPQPVKSENLQGYEGLTPATTGKRYCERVAKIRKDNYMMCTQKDMQKIFSKRYLHACMHKKI